MIYLKHLPLLSLYTCLHLSSSPTRQLLVPHQSLFEPLCLLRLRLLLDAFTGFPAIPVVAPAMTAHLRSPWLRSHWLTGKFLPTPFPARNSLAWYNCYVYPNPGLCKLYLYYSIHNAIYFFFILIGSCSVSQDLKLLELCLMLCEWMNKNHRVREWLWSDLFVYGDIFDCCWEEERERWRLVWRERSGKCLRCIIHTIVHSTCHSTIWHN